MISFRAKDFNRVSANMLLRLERFGLENEQKLALVRLAKGSSIDEGVSWGGAKKMISDVLRFINDRRGRDGRPAMDEDELRDAIRSLLVGRRREPLVEELSDALANLREARLGVRKVPPLAEDGVKKIA